MKRIYVADSYSLNTGDLGILEATLEALSDAFPGAEITLEVSHPGAYRRADLAIYPRTLDIAQVTNRQLSNALRMRALLLSLYDATTFLVWAVLWRLVLPSSWVLRQSKRKQASALSGADVYVSSGGGFLSSYYHYQLRLYGYLLAFLLDKPVVLLAQSIGPFNTAVDRTLAKAFLNKVDLITAREPWSHEYLHSLALRTRITQTADMAFLLTPEPLPAPLPKDKLVALCVREAASNKDRYNEAIIKSIGVLRALNYQPLVVSQTPADDQIAYSISNSAGKNCPVFPFGLPPRQLKYLYGKCSLVVASRMHAIVFAAAQGVPWVAIGYEPKFKGLLNQLKERGLALSEGSVNAESLAATIKRAMAIPKVDESHESISRQRRLAADNIVALRGVL